MPYNNNKRYISKRIKHGKEVAKIDSQIISIASDLEIVLTLKNYYKD